MKYAELEQHLKEISDKKFADFSKSLSNSEYISLGVKNPVLRALIKDHKNDEELKLEDFKLGKYLEVDFVYFGLALSRAKTIEEQLNFIENNIKNGKSWVLTDCSQTYIKKCDFETFYNFFQKMCKSKFTYDRRFAYVFALKFTKNPEILGVFHQISLNEEYMVMMAEAWFLATVAIMFPNDVYAYLKGINDKTLRRKTISKMCDSYRISNEVKTKFKGLRNEK